MLRLAQAMESQPTVGLIQTVPVVAGCSTLFGRWQQFAARLYGPVATAGLLWWSGAEGSFWGHNAIIRVRAFAESCGLRSEEHTSELQSLMRISYAVFCLKKKKKKTNICLL